MAYLKLHGIESAILTDGQYEVQKIKTNVIGARDFFQTIIYTDKLGKDYWNPNTKGFELLKEKFNVEYEEMLYVGDNPMKDFYISKNIPIHTARVMRDDAIYQNESYLEDVMEEYTFNDFRDLWNILSESGAKISSKFLE